jgi:hypothetical protein
MSKEDESGELGAPDVIFVREAWGRFADDIRAGKVVSVDTAAYYARQGSHWIKYVRAKAVERECEDLLARIALLEKQIAALE